MLKIFHSFPNECRYCPGSFTGNVTPNSKVYVLHTERTRFRVRLINERMDTTGTILIGSDDILTYPSESPAALI